MAAKGVYSYLHVQQDRSCANRIMAAGTPVFLVVLYVQYDVEVHVAATFSGTEYINIPDGVLKCYIVDRNSHTRQLRMTFSCRVKTHAKTKQ